MAVKVAIDAGHGGFDNGAVYKGRREKDDNLAIALELGRILQNNGIEVAYTRTDDRYDSPVQKAQLANATGADYLVSIHRNAAYAPNTYSGVQTLVYDNSGVRKELAEAINNELEDIGFNNINVETRKDLGILRRSNMPAVLVEVGFIDNDYDNSVLDQSINRTAQAIADGILDVVGTQAASASEDSGGKAVAVSANESSEDKMVAVSGKVAEGNYMDSDENSYYESVEPGSRVTSETGRENNAVDRKKMIGDRSKPDERNTVIGERNAEAGQNSDIVERDIEIERSSMVNQIVNIDALRRRRDDKEYKLQAGLFRVYRYAKDLERELASMGYDTDIEKEGEYFVVYVEGFKSLEAATKAEAELKRKGYDNFVVEK